LNQESLNFQQIVKEFTPMMYSIAYRLLGNKEESVDVVQDTFMKVYKNRERFSAEKNLKNWLYTITINTARDSYRKKKRLAETERKKKQEVERKLKQEQQKVKARSKNG